MALGSEYRASSRMVITGPRDSLGRAPFDLYWWCQSNDRPRGQCFRAIPEEYLKRDDIEIVESEAIAKELAWGKSA